MKQKPMKVDVLEDAQTGQTIDIRLDKQTGEFQAEINGKMISNKILPMLKKDLNARLHAFKDLTFIPVIRIESDFIGTHPGVTPQNVFGGFLPGRDHFALDFDFTRLWIAKRPEPRGEDASLWLGCDWATPAEARASRASSTWIRVETVPGWCYQPNSRSRLQFVLHYTDEMWEILRGQRQVLTDYWQGVEHDLATRCGEQTIVK